MQSRSLALAGLVACAQALDTVQYGAFLATATYSVANQLGFFTENGLNVIYNQVPNSTAAFASILNGQYDILTATVDNALNYRFNQNQNVTVIGQLDQGPDLVLASIPSITSIDQLKGKPIIVDSPLSGYAYLLQDVLATHGLTLANNDYYFMTVGGTPQRFSALVNEALPNGTAVYATILTYPFAVEGDALAPGQAPNILARISDVVAPVTSSAFTIRQSSLSNKAENALLTRFMASMYAANKFLLNPKNKPCSIQALVKQLGVSQAVATQEYASATNLLSGEVSPPLNDFTVNPTGIMNDVDIRKQFGGFSVPATFNFAKALVPGVGKLIDYSIKNAAVEQYKKHPLTGNCTQSCKPHP
ncbi:NMT1 domain-containing protein [Trichoderma simmonsii]|uniref:NMT1 domain-containing protein n=1 Tax=Trichoderma simmonsii TaxID=1491479 RepID=A0A8G0LCP2_9HYPO|nr:NMT1 domain-containing protein [Trichoderma simmonsii]